MICRPLDRSWSGIAHVRIVTKSPQNANCERRANLNLARQPKVRRKIGNPCKALRFSLGLWGRFTVDDLNPASCATGVATTAMENVDPRILDAQYKPTAFRALDFAHAFNLDCRHLLRSPFTFPKLI